MTIKKYKIIDIAILTSLAIVIDLISYWLLGAADGEGRFNFFITPSIALLIIIYIRWGWAGVFPNLLIALIHLVVYQKELLVHYNRWIPYLVAFMTLFINILWKKVFGSVIIKSRLVMITLYFLVTFTLLIVAEWMIALSLGSDIELFTYFVRNVFNMLIAFAIILIATFQKGLVVDVESYLIKMKNEEKDVQDG